MKLDELFRRMISNDASDLHLRAHGPPVFRIDGSLVRQVDYPFLTPADLDEVFEQITTSVQKDNYAQKLDLDFAYSVPGVSRFRVSIIQQRGTKSIAFRKIPFEIPTIDNFGLPQLCKELVIKPRGLILITGATGSGKSTTLAAMLDYLNETEERNVITIEDPIEYLHRDKKCLIAQREYNEDAYSFSDALVHALRHDPDVLIIGEMRELATITMAITAAETGHLVIGTLHTQDAVQAVERIIDVYPPVQQQQIRLQMSQVLEAVLSQTLVHRANGKGRVAAFEIMTANPAVRNLIREGKPQELSGIIQLSRKEGMQTLDQALLDLVKGGTITREEALLKSSNPEMLSKSLQQKPAQNINAVRGEVLYR